MCCVVHRFMSGFVTYILQTKAVDQQALNYIPTSCSCSKLLFVVTFPVFLVGLIYNRVLKCILVLLKTFVYVYLYFLKVLQFLKHLCI